MWDGENVVNENICFVNNNVKLAILPVDKV